MRHYCTLFDRNYLKYFLALYESMKVQCEPFTMHVLGLDDQVMHNLAGLKGVMASPVLAIETGQLRQLKSERPYRDYVWTLKPQWIHHILANVPGSITYLDADSYFFHSPNELYEEIGEERIAITPHRFPPSRARLPLSVGTFNAGFVYFKEEHECLIQWCEQTLECCERSPGFCNDQKYLDEWPELWGAHVIRHKGVNAAPWNQGEEQYTYTCWGGLVYVDEDPLVWYHFHQHLKPHYKIDPFVQEFLYKPYAEKLKAIEGMHEDCGGGEGR